MLQVAGRVTLLCSLITGIACGGGSSAIPAPFTDGSRLVAQQLSYPGTTPLFVGIYDRDEGVACEFRPAADGSNRCLPPNDAAAAQTPERWVKGRLYALATGQRLVRNEIHGDDNSVFPALWWGELYDTRTFEPCSADFRTGMPNGTCLPRHAEITSMFADDTCAVRVATSAEDSREPLLAVDDKGALFSLGGEWVGTTFIGFGTTCLELPLTATRAYLIGEPLPANTVASLRAIPLGDGRLGLKTLEAGGGGITTMPYRHYPGQPTPDSAPYWDGAHGLFCSPMATVDGDTLCLPADASVETRPDLLAFADGSCEQPVIAFARAYAIFAESDAAGPRAYEVHRVGTVEGATAFEKSDTGACNEAIKRAGYPVGEAVSLSAFARLTVKP
jgi:hypothetical protein